MISLWRHYLRIFSASGLRQLGGGGYLLPPSLPRSLPQWLHSSFHAKFGSTLTIRTQRNNTTTTTMHAPAVWKAEAGHFIHDSDLKEVTRQLPVAVNSGCRNLSSSFLFPAGTLARCLITTLLETCFHGPRENPLKFGADKEADLGILIYFFNIVRWESFWYRTYLGNGVWWVWNLLHLDCIYGDSWRSTIYWVPF